MYSTLSPTAAPFHFSPVPSLRKESGSTFPTVSSPETPPQQPCDSERQVLYGTSKTWISEPQKETDRWQSALKSFQRRFSQQALLPWDRTQWIEHRQAAVTERRKRLQRRMADMQDRQRRRLAGEPPLDPLHGRAFACRPWRSAVLAENTMWRDQGPQEENSDVWPDQSEMRYEGDERISTEGGRFRRMLPMVRYRPIYLQYLSWDKLYKLGEFDFDRVWYFPTDPMEACEEVAQVDEKDIPAKLNQDLLASIDADDWM